MKLKKDGNILMHRKDQGRGELFYKKLWNEFGECGGTWIALQMIVWLLADSGLKIVEMTEEEKKKPFYPNVRREGEKPR